MTAIWPCYFIWSGEVMTPLDRFKSRAADQFTVGEAYRLVHEEEASTESRGHYFATLKNMFDSLPENLASRFPDMDSLRYWSLIRCGYAEENMIPCKTEADAIRTVNLLAKLSPHAVFVIKGDVVQMFRARSQSTKSMGRELFQRSKQDVLELVAHMIGVNLEQMARPPNSRPEPPFKVEEAAALERAPTRPMERHEPEAPAPVPPKATSERSPPQNGGNRPSSHVAPSRDWKAFPPRNAQDYRTYLSDWVMALRDEGTILARWENEAPLRDACGLSSADTDACRAMMERRILLRPSV